MHCIIFSGGGVVDGFFVQESIKFADLIIAADSGADAALEFDVIPSVILGDFDSLDTQTQKQLKEKNIECISYNSNKDETDTELAVTYAIKKGATKISILGGTEGNRIDHVLGNIFLSSSSLKCKIVFITGRQKFWIVEGPAKEKFSGNIGDLLSLIPISEEITGVQNSGLKFELNNESLYFGKTRGVSNEFISKEASVSFEKGKLLFIQTF